MQDAYLDIMTSYSDFVARKLTRSPPTGLTDHGPISDFLFPFQADLVAWALRRGRAAIFASTGLGKTRMQLEWARHIVAAHTGSSVLILAPLAVAQQTVAEGANMGVEVKLCRDGSEIVPGINITNYDRLHRFDGSKFVGVCLDESSCIKHCESKTLALLMAAFESTPFKLCATATPAPNDYTELGTHAEFLGICSQSEMLSEHFVHDGGETQVWRLKKHARGAFWKFVATWGAMIRMPSDLGYDDTRYVLPELKTIHHTIASDLKLAREAGFLFPMEAQTLSERRGARRATISQRVAECVRTVNADRQPWIVWCDLNAESEQLAKQIDGSVEIRGSHTIEQKEAKLDSFLNGRSRVLVSKSSICGFGLNVQCCCRMAFVGITDSWEAFFQAVRRCWRFGQTKPVEVHIYASDLEGNVVKNILRKEADAEKMAIELGRETSASVRESVYGQARQTRAYEPTKQIVMPDWIRSEE